MKALTVTQPWATLVAIGAKRIETRSWSTSYRGPLAIHAAKTFPRAAQMMCWVDPFAERLRQAGYETGRIEKVLLPLGAVIATCNLIDVIKIGSTRHAHTIILRHLALRPTQDDELRFGDYTSGRYAWLLADAKWRDPIPATGALGLWEWDPVATVESRPRVPASLFDQAHVIQEAH